MPKKKYTYDYPRPAVTVDVVILTREKSPRVLLIQRGREPYAGMWALPGGFVEIDEDLETAARRELLEETGVAAGHLQQIGAFGAPGRDPRGRTISVAYLALVNIDDVAPQAADDAAAAAWHPLRRLPPLAFDHREIVKVAQKMAKKT